MLAQCAATINREQFCEQISKICHAIPFSDSEDLCRHRLVNGVIINSVMLICKHRLRYCRILYDTVVVTAHISWTVDRYPEHLEFVA